MVGIAVPFDLDLARNIFGHKFCQGTKLIIVLVRSDVENLLVHFCWVGAQHENLGARRIFYVDHGTPLCAVPHQREHAGLPGAVGHTIDGEIKSHARAETVNRRLAQDNHDKIVGGEGEYSMLSRFNCGSAHECRQRILLLVSRWQ